MTIGWHGRAIWPTEGTEPGGQNIALELQTLRFSQSTGPGRSTTLAQDPGKRQSQSSTRAQSGSPDHSPSSRFSRQKPRDGRDVRRPGARKGGK